MSYLLPHLHSGWAVDQAILADDERVVIIRFGHDWDDTCMQMEDFLSSKNPLRSDFLSDRRLRRMGLLLIGIPFSLSRGLGLGNI